MRVACIAMQRNEGSLLSTWANYHSALFGSENIFLFDNGSDESETLHILDELQKRGINVDRQYIAPSDFEKKGDIIGHLIMELVRDGRYDIYMPLDADEMVGVQTGTTSFSPNQVDIFEELDKHRSVKPVSMIGGSFYNIPLSNSFYFRREQKCFFGRDNFGSLDIGFHWGKSKYSTHGTVASRIVHAHFQNKPYELLLEHARNKLRVRVPSMDILELAKYKGQGHHLARYFLISREQYYTELGEINDLTTLPEFERFIKALGAEFPFAR